MGEKNLKKMADLLKDGATLLSQTCPACFSPLFRLRTGETFCAACERRVIIPSLGEDVTRVVTESVIDELEQTIAKKLHTLQQTVDNEADIQRLSDLSKLMDAFLQALQRIRTLKEKQGKGHS